MSYSWQLQLARNPIAKRTQLTPEELDARIAEMAPLVAALPSFLYWHEIDGPEGCAAAALAMARGAVRSAEKAWVFDGSPRPSVPELVNRLDTLLKRK